MLKKRLEEPQYQRLYILTVHYNQWLWPIPCPQLFKRVIFISYRCACLLCLNKITLEQWILPADKALLISDLPKNGPYNALWLVPNLAIISNTSPPNKIHTDEITQKLDKLISYVTDVCFDIGSHIACCTQSVILKVHV